MLSLSITTTQGLKNMTAININAQTYSTKSTAMRGAKRAGLNVGSFTIETNDVGQWQIVLPPPPPPPAPTEEKTSKGRATRIGPTYKELTASRERSKIEKPLEYIWAYLNEHGEKMTRKTAIVQLVNAGVNYSTARTQYQYWFERQHEDA